ncbi:innexin unc-9-like [Mercenaria mercenaria]|uniref:innexin unc-9-like n=1 Tax=Mercenaria mercenaria TaxID=6596 RepID=UPI00234F7AD4|nr:innexin unc-9-like [Mercenaria mercenaria]XP_045161269.2 innexin unc-9-like [Mercenaria mercenaria]
MPFPADILGSWVIWDKLTGNNDDDWVDRLNHIYTVVILAVFSVFVAGSSYVGEPIACWHPAEYTAHQVKYANSYCWIKNTYYVPMSDTIPRDNRDHVHLEITYYQYVPLILLFMAFLFKLPCLIWRNFSGYSGIDLPKVVELTTNTHYIEDSKRLEKINEISMVVDRWLEANRQYHWNILVRLRQRLSRVCFCMNRREGTYLTGLYMFVKLLFAVNVVSQFFILDAFLDGFFSLWGIEAMYSLAHEYAIKESRRFPRVTLCDFEVRRLHLVQPHTVQCVLPINLFNEKVFLFIWFWFIIVALITCSNILFWFWRSLFQRNRTCFVKKYLTVSSRIHTSMDKKLCKKFATYLRDDGIFLIRMIQKNSNDILVTDLIARLWEIYLEKPVVKKMLMTSDGGNTGNNNRIRGTAPPAKENYI